MGSQPGGAHKSPVVDWVAVYIMLVGTCVIGAALPLKWWWLGVVGAVVFVVGAAIAMAYGIMNHTEDYEVHPKPADPDPEPADSLERKRIVSA